MNNIILPKGWQDIYLDQFIALKKMDDSESSFFVKQIETLAILTDTTADDELWEEMDMEELETVIKDIKWIRTEPSLNYQKEIGEYTAIDIYKITLGEYWDIDQWMYTDMFGNLPKICAAMYRRTRRNDWGNLEIEPYGNYDFDARSKEFEEVKINEVYGLLNYFKDFKELIHVSYKDHFEAPIEEDPEDDYEFTPEEVAEIEKEKRQARWGWEQLIYKLADGDILKFEAITNLPIIQVFNHLTMVKDLGLVS